MSEEILKEINGLMGCVNGNTIEHVRKIVRLLSVYKWAVDMLYHLVDHRDVEYAKQERDKIMNKLKDANKED